MNCCRQIRSLILHNTNWKKDIISTSQRYINLSNDMFRPLCTSKWLKDQTNISRPLRPIKPKSQKGKGTPFLDIKQVKVIGGNGGDGQISMAQTFSNENAGPDGGDGGNGGHVIFQASINTTDLSNVDTILKADDGERGSSKECFGKNAKHRIINVPIGTIIRNAEGKIVGDLNSESDMFLAARGGAGGHGNAYFKSDVNQAPLISECGATGEILEYVLEVRSMAHVGMIGLPNAGKSTLLQAISRAKPKVAPYAFTTLQPHLGMILYDDYEQIAVADLPGLIEDSHKNKGLGIQFLKHVERCHTLLFILDVTSNEPWTDFNILKYEISQFNAKLNERPLLIAANKIDLPNAKENLKLLRQKLNYPIIPISAKMGTNITTLLKEIKMLYDTQKKEDEQENILKRMDDFN